MHTWLLPFLDIAPNRSLAMTTYQINRNPAGTHKAMLFKPVHRAMPAGRASLGSSGTQALTARQAALLSHPSLAQLRLDRA